MPATMSRHTGETSIDVFLDIKGSGNVEANTGIEMLDFIIRTMGSAGGFDLKVTAKGDLPTGDHHTAEDVGITLGQAIGSLVKTGTGSSTVPSGECLATAAVRFSRPGYCAQFTLPHVELGGMALENFGHLIRAMAYNGKFTLHLIATGPSEWQKIEAMAMAIGRALKKASNDSA